MKKTAKRNVRVRRSAKAKAPLIYVAIFVLLGVGFLFKSFAAEGPVALPDQPSKGVFYQGLKVQRSGPCKGEVDLSDASDKKHGRVNCGHIDPGPQGVDFRERAKQMDKKIKALDAYDAKHPSLKTNAPIPKNEQDTTTSYTVDGSNPPADLVGDMSGNVAGRNWPCKDLGIYGYRVRVIYVYVAGATNRVNDRAAFMNNSMKRVNAIMYNSSGGHRQIRFSTNESNCALSIGVVPVSGSIVSYSNIVNTLKAHGYDNANKKYMVFVDAIDDGTPCGLGGGYIDNTSSPANNIANGKVPEYAVVWRGCWDYAEPHELMHTLGTVSPDAPHGTPGQHCTDQHDIMCYDDDGSGPVKMTTPCAYKSFEWRYDCNHNDYFDATSPSGWLATHWNVANSYFLIRQ